MPEVHASSAHVSHASRSSLAPPQPDSTAAPQPARMRFLMQSVGGRSAVALCANERGRRLGVLRCASASALVFGRSRIPYSSA
ncbi:hypothetical protein SCP_1600240 [Sparassis crispa]|uniref:Uncharacterized protein n=1 Tax=Sparassis crispa TaxID=139825 RepID=A0A401H4N5_9APHY|nr:hypothetical protein SCP_1600240 [Sparassis crispa]GBE89363.1 hypothetical protein SCP_1600240 [Sparassis crispa]